MMNEVKIRLNETKKDVNGAFKFPKYLLIYQTYL